MIHKKNLFLKVRVMRQKRKNTSSNLEKQKKCTDKYEYIYLPKDPFKKHPNKKGECYLIRRGEV